MKVNYWGASVTNHLALSACGVGVDEEGFGEVLAVEVAGGEKSAAYASLLGGLLDRLGLWGVKVVVSDDDHEGIKAAVLGELAGVECQRCIVHFERNVVLSHVPAFAVGEVVAQDLKAIFEVRRQKTAWTLAEEFVALYEERFPKATSRSFPNGYRVRPNLPPALAGLSARQDTHDDDERAVERLFEEEKRRTRVVGVFPNETSASTFWRRRRSC